jgi:hypothetical protein
MEWKTKRKGPWGRRWEHSWCFSNYFTAERYNSARFRRISTDMRISMRNKTLLSILLASALVGGAGVTAIAQNNDAGQDMRDAGRHTKDAAKDAGQATKSTTRKAYHKSKKGTRKAYNKTKKGTHKAYDKTKEGGHKAYNKTKAGVKNTHDKVTGKRQSNEENPH